MQSQMTDSQLQAIQDRDAEIAQLEVSPFKYDLINFAMNDIFTNF